VINRKARPSAASKSTTTLGGELAKASMAHRLRIVVLSLVTLLSACADSALTPTSSLSDKPSLDVRSSSAENRDDDVPVVDRFTIAVSAVGDLRPGSPVRINATVTAAIATGAADIRITLPELEIAETTGWQRNARIPTKSPIRARRQERYRFLPGETARIGETVTFREPGYYRVVVTAIPASKEASTDVDGGCRNPAFGKSGCT
jgi:hypothetical protein